MPAVRASRSAMNILLVYLALVAQGASIMPKIIFWILLILWAIGTFPKWENPNVTRGTAIIEIILFGILGYYTFSF